MPEIRVNMSVSFAVDATAWAQHRDLDASHPDAVRTDFLTYVRSKKVGGLAGHIALLVDEVGTVNGAIRLGAATLVQPPPAES